MSLLPGSTAFRVPNSKAEEDSLAAIELAEQIGYVIFAPTIIAAGILGSLANLFILNDGKFSNRFYTYLKGLAVADLCFLCFAVSGIIHVFQNQADRKEYGGNINYIKLFYEAHFENGIINGFLASSVFIIVMMTIDRYLAISHPTLYRRRRSSNSPLNSPIIDIGLAFYAGMVIQAPRYFTLSIQNIDCIVANRNETFSPLCKCEKSQDENGGFTCVYIGEEVESVTESAVWITYVVLIEIMMRIGPCVLLVTLNIRMIQDFNESLRRRRQLMASCFSVTSSALFPMIEGDGEDPENPETSSSLFSMKIPKRVRYLSENSVSSTEPSNKAKTMFGLAPSKFMPNISKLRSKLEGSEDARNQSLMMSSKEKNVIIVLGAISVVFVGCNIPQSICRILISQKYEFNTAFQVFRVIANILELLNASMNFFIYCLCNQEVRERVKQFGICCKGQLSGRKRALSISKEASSDALKEMFPAVFQGPSKIKGKKVLTPEELRE
ncbi:probable G-protein coupled receptor B0563.6 [Tigriopus californicus]|nr:probable G-protein coupled receptor B0563.6 [Tigriopus californicus]